MTHIPAWNNVNLFAIAGVCCAFALAPSAVATAQSRNAAGTFVMQSPLDRSTGDKVVTDSLGRPCLDVEAAARSQTVNRSAFDHIVSIKNKCVRPIKVRICYKNSDRCVDAQVQGYARVDTILGTAVGMDYFAIKIFQQ